MGLLATLYLISSNVYGSLPAPQNRGFSYIEVWTSGTQTITMFAIIEYGFILGLKKYAKSTKITDKLDLMSFFFAVIICIYHICSKLLVACFDV